VEQEGLTEVVGVFRIREDVVEPAAVDHNRCPPSTHWILVVCVKVGQPTVGHSGSERLASALHKVRPAGEAEAYVADDHVQ
jgi:hypothetical protein